MSRGEPPISNWLAAGYYEGLLGTVHDLRIVLLDNDTRLLFAATYDGDLRPYVADVIATGSSWTTSRAD